MSTVARRQSSTTSLSRYAREQSPDAEQRSLDFCNAFWGPGDGGVDVLFARIRGAGRTTEELRAFWRERAAIEDDYAKRLAKLAKLALGKDEIGELRNAIDTLRQETDRQATSHSQLALSMKRELEGPSTDFIAKQVQHKKTFQANIEKSFKAKQTQEAYVAKAQEKYQADCIKINSFTAQSTLVQGKDLEKIQLRLEKAQQTVHQNERDYANFARALADTTRKWEGEWKAYCDQCQDLEDERIEFMKDNMWTYANAVSTVCVSDDESCEKVRVALEQVEVDKDMVDFVRKYATGSHIPDPMPFHSFQSNTSPPRPSVRPANFARSSTKSIRSIPPPPPPQDDEPTGPGKAGVGAGNGRESRASQRSLGPFTNGSSISPASAGPPSVTQTQSTGPYSAVTLPSPQSQIPPPSQMQAPPPSQQIPQYSQLPQALPGLATAGAYRGAPPPSQPDPHAEPIDPSAKLQLAIGPNVYDVDPNQDPQRRPPTGTPTLPPVSGVGDADDPIAKALADLRRPSMRRKHDSAAAGTGTGAQSPRDSSSLTKRPSMRAPASATTPPPGSQPSSVNKRSSLAAPGAPTNLDYQSSADSVVGSHPSRPNTPVDARPQSAIGDQSSPPRANFMQPPKATSPTVAPDDYGQQFPAERRLSVRRRSGGAVSPGPMTEDRGRMQQRPTTPVREGFAGIGAQGRSPSPQPFAQSHSRSSSPYHGPPPQQPLQPPPPPNLNAIRAASPSQIGIALDASGNVQHDKMAEDYQRRSGLYQQQQQQQQQAMQRAYYQQQPPPTPTPAYAQPPPPPPQQQPLYTPHPPPPPPQTYVAPPAHYGPQNGYVAPPPQQQPPRQQLGTPAPYGAYPQQQQQQQYAGYGQQPQQRAPSPAVMQQPLTRSPSPLAPAPLQQAPPQAGPSSSVPPTGHFLEDGTGVLFYVKALYDYTATIDEEFDFQTGDIIAVTATPEDGWWSGVLLDDARRIPGKHLFPSNFVSLF